MFRSASSSAKLEAKHGPRYAFCECCHLDSTAADASHRGYAQLSMSPSTRRVNSFPPAPASLTTVSYTLTGNTPTVLERSDDKVRTWRGVSTPTTSAPVTRKGWEGGRELPHRTCSLS
jgi:hypothetical protein